MAASGERCLGSARSSEQAPSQGDGCALEELTSGRAVLGRGT